GHPLPNTQPHHVNASDHVPNQVVIVFTPNSSQQDRNAYIRSIGGRSRKQVNHLNVYIVNLQQDVDPSTLPPSPIVVRIERDGQAGATQAEPPNDPRYGDQWALPVIGAPLAWAQLGGSSQQVIVAVIDSGICPNHPDLLGRIVAGYDFVDDD